MPELLITTPSIDAHDAVSNDVWRQRDTFQKQGWHVYIYAEHAPMNFSQELITWAQVCYLVGRENLFWIHHHSIFWDKLETLLEEARCRRYLRYHNITPPEFFVRYKQKGAVYATRRGIKQTESIVRQGGFTGFIPASQFNSQELQSFDSIGTPTEVIAPFHTLNDFENATLVSAIEPEFNPDKLHLLFVGRFAPNKGHLHLLNTLRRYREFYDDQVCLHLVGAVKWAPKAYLTELTEFINRYGLGSSLKIWDSVDFNILYTLYHKADIFLLMSEHEGFCVPVIEAQYLRLPVVGLNRAAVGETLGANQICFDQPDYDQFAAALRVVHEDLKTKEFLINEGVRNQERFSIETLEEKLYDFVAQRSCRALAQSTSHSSNTT